MFGVVRTDAQAHTQAQAASAGPQTPGYVARRDEVSLGESALGSHTRPGGLISSTRLGLHWAGIFHGPSLREGGEGGTNGRGIQCPFSGFVVGPKLECTPSPSPSLIFSMFTGEET